MDINTSILTVILFGIFVSQVIEARRKRKIEERNRDTEFFNQMWALKESEAELVKTGDLDRWEFLLIKRLGLLEMHAENLANHLIPSRRDQGQKRVILRELSHVLRDSKAKQIYEGLVDRKDGTLCHLDHLRLTANQS
nr:hypothetical protein [uncultured Cohaesibacter sp.]